MKSPKNPRYKFIEFILLHQKEIKAYNGDEAMVIERRKIANPKGWSHMIEILASKLSAEQVDILGARYVANESYVKTSQRLHISERTYLNLLTDIRQMAYMIAIELGLVSVIHS